MQKIVAPYEGRCLSLAEINNLLRDITNAYIAKGYVTTRAFVDPSQNTQDQLKILVVEGFIEKIILNEGDRNDYYRGQTAFPGLEGKPLNLRDIEQGIDQLNRLPSSDATMELAPGKEMGGSIVNVTIPPKRSWRLGAGVDNLGQRNSGQYQYNLSFEKDNFMGIGDQFAVYWSEDAPMADRLLNNRQKIGHNHSLSTYASLPWGYWTFSANMSKSSYETTIFGMNTTYLSSGTTDYYSVQAERVIHRDEDSKTSLGLSLNTRDVDNFIEHIRLLASSYVLTTGTATLSHNRRFLGGMLGGNFDYTKGLRILGTKRQTESGHDIPKSDFDKFALSLNWYKPFAVGSEQFYYSASAYGQFTDATLFGAERVSIGSKYSVRGFHEQMLTGDTGGYLRQELGWNIPLPESWQSPDLIQGLQVYTSYDYGFIQADKKDPYERGRMQGISVGLRTHGALNVDIAIAKPIAHPSFIHARDMECYASLRYVF